MFTRIKSRAKETDKCSLLSCCCTAVLLSCAATGLGDGAGYGMIGGVAFTRTKQKDLTLCAVITAVILSLLQSWVTARAMA